MQVKKVIFICNDDKFYTLPALHSIVKSQSLLNIKVDKILVSKYKSKSSSLLYRLKFLKNISNFYRLFLYIIYLLINRSIRIIKGNVSFNHLSNRYDIDIEFVESLNELSTNEVRDLSNNVDLGIIMIDEVLSESFINNFNKLIINKHSSMLPEGRGLFPHIRIFTDNIQMIVIGILLLVSIIYIDTVSGSKFSLEIIKKNNPHLLSSSYLPGYTAGFTFIIAVAATNLFHQGNWQRVFAVKDFYTLKRSLIFLLYSYYFDVI